MYGLLTPPLHVCARLLDRSEVWGRLAERSLLRYRAIELEAGLQFYSECGFLSLIDDKVDNLVNTFIESSNICCQYKDPEKLDHAMDTLQESGYSCEKVQADRLR